jgi:hypothetical protein
VEIKGLDLLPIIVEVHLWAEKYFDIPADLKVMIKEAKKDKNEFIKVTTRQLKKQIAPLCK